MNHFICGTITHAMKATQCYFVLSTIQTLFSICHKFVKMEKPVLYGSELSPAVRGVLLTAKAMDLELEIRFVFKIELFELVVC